jgi:hypothetical protein
MASSFLTEPCYAVAGVTHERAFWIVVLCFVMCVARSCFVETFQPPALPIRAGVGFTAVDPLAPPSAAPSASHSTEQPPP